jgi:hypothetical protein
MNGKTWNRGRERMNDFLRLVLASIISGTVISTILGLLFHRRITQMEQTITGQYEWKQRSVTELLGPLYMQFDRTRRAFERWSQANQYLEAKVIMDGNVKIRDLLLTKGDLIPPDLRGDAGRLVAHYDRWLEEYEKVRGEHNPALDQPFVFVGPQGFPFPRDAEARFKDAYIKIWDNLYKQSLDSLAKGK